MLLVWGYQQFIPTIMLDGVSETNKPYILMARGLVLGLLVTMMILVYYAWKKYNNTTTEKQS